MRKDVITAAPIGLRVNGKRVAGSIGVSHGSARQVTDEADAIQSLAATSSALIFTLLHSTHEQKAF
jgi:hypothetical protein